MSKGLEKRENISYIRKRQQYPLVFLRLSSAMEISGICNNELYAFGVQVVLPKT